MKMKTAGDLFHCIESGEGWESCGQFCTPEATFDCQVIDALPDMPSLANIKTVKGFANWQMGVVHSLGDKVWYQLTTKWNNEYKAGLKGGPQVTRILLAPKLLLPIS